ncbi:accessory factor UbiK family protein [Propionivibrio sp.]|uniref:accessory factor UbiK family protein n=1 Tax=Propionivibrio sp. TaxID=2212460 RepID=UPI00345B4E71
MPGCFFFCFPAVIRHQDDSWLISAHCWRTKNGHRTKPVPGVVLVRCAKLDASQNPVSRKTDAMLDPKVFEEFSNRLSTLIAASPAADIEKNARALMSGFFARLDLVTREEFDIQAQVLQRTREMLKALEERVARLENPPSGD